MRSVVKAGEGTVLIMAVELFTLREIAQFSGKSYARIARIALVDAWPIARPANRKLGQCALYRFDVVQLGLARRYDKAA